MVEHGLTNEMDRLKIIAMDDIFSTLKKGASVLWDNRHALFPTVAPMIDKAITTGKLMISQLGGKDLGKHVK